MSKTINRLKKSMDKYLAETAYKGKKAGKNWAKIQAEYWQLVRMEQYFEYRDLEEYQHEGLEAGIDLAFTLPIDLYMDEYGEDAYDIFWSEVFGDAPNHRPDDLFVLSFIEGALSYFDEIHAKILDEAA